jgi:sorbitol-specific phosphotransferase system component IIBC
MSDKKETLYQKEAKKQKNIQSQIMDEAQEFKKQFSARTLKLVTSGLGLVAALAWNEVIKETVNIYIKPFFGEGSGLISLLIYAVLVTALVVFVSYQLSKLGLEEKE